jgi:hypothetical protein
MPVYEDVKVEYRTAYFNELCRAHFSGNDLKFDVDGGAAVTVATLTAPRPVGGAGSLYIGAMEDADGTLRVTWQDDTGTAPVQYYSRDRGATWTLVV